MSYLFQYVHFAQDVWRRSFSQWSAASPGYIQIFLRKEKKTKKCNPKINPKTKGRKKKVHFFPVQASSGRQRLWFPWVHFEKSAARRRLVREKTLISVEVLKQSGASFSLVDDLVDGGLLVTGSCHDVFVICWDVAAQDGGRLLRL